MQRSDVASTVRRIFPAVSTPRSPRSVVIPVVLARRVRLLTALFTSLAASSLVVQVSLAPLLSEQLPEGLDATTLQWEGGVATALLLAASVAIFLYAGRRDPSSEVLAALAAVHMLMLTLTIATFEAVMLHGREPPWGVSWNCVLVVLYPLVVPSSSVRTAALATLGVACSPIMLAIAERTGLVHPYGQTYVTLGVDGAVAVVLSVVGSRVVYRLGQEAGRSMELGSYQLEARIAVGGMGEVWRARHRLLFRPAAIKIVRPEVLAATPEEATRLLLRFEREAQATAVLESPHTVRLLDFGVTDDGAFYYAMELLDGIDLRDLVQDYGPVGPGRTAHLLLQACHALEEAHAFGLVHRDVKPANLMACRLGRDVDFVKVCDFGLVKWHTVPQGQESLHLTGEGDIPGTPAFLAPEAVIAHRDVDARSDVYSLGCVAFWLLTGRLVFEAENALEMAVKHVQEAPSPPSAYAELPIPPQLDALILACLAKDPEQRPQDAAALGAQLEALDLADRWTAEDARRWWDLHLPTSDADRAARVQRASLRPFSRRRKKPRGDDGVSG